MTGRLPIIVVGQTPPPVHGQALAIERLVRTDFARLELHHVRMDYSHSMEEVGRFRFGKVLTLAGLIIRVLMVRFASGAVVLYYPPAGPALIPVIRDMLFLLAVRPFFTAVIFDFHAGGLDAIASRLPWPVSLAYRRAYHNANLVIEKYPAGVSAIVASARRRSIVPYGIEDAYRPNPAERSASNAITVLYVGVITPPKGVLTLLSSIALLLRRGIHARAVLVGEPRDHEEAERLEVVIRKHDLHDHVRLTGLLSGEDKWREFRAADVFCFPTFYENEALPIAIIEAMQFELPVVGSDWRGVPSLVRTGETGFIVPPRDPAALADRLEELAERPELRRRMGRAARQLYLERYTVDAHLAGMEEALASVAEDVGGNKWQNPGSL